jgi:hypothetical protein
VFSFVCESVQRAEGFFARRTSEGRKAGSDIMRADKAATSALAGSRGSNKFSIFFTVDIVRPFNGRKGNPRIFDELGCFDQGSEIKRPHQRRARSLERDHRAVLTNDRDRSEFQSRFKGCSGRRARLGGDYVAHLDAVGCGKR